MDTFISYAVTGIGYTGLILIILASYYYIVGMYVKVIGKIRKIDYKWLLFLSTAYRNKISPESRYEELKELIETCHIRNVWLDSKVEEKQGSLDLLKDIKKLVDAKIKSIEK